MMGCFLQRPVVSVVSRGAQQAVPKVGDVVTAKVGPVLHMLACTPYSIIVLNTHEHTVLYSQTT